MHHQQRKKDLSVSVVIVACLFSLPRQSETAGCHCGLSLSLRLVTLAWHCCVLLRSVTESCYFGLALLLSLQSISVVYYLCLSLPVATVAIISVW